MDARLLAAVLLAITLPACGSTGLAPAVLVSRPFATTSSSHETKIQFILYGGIPKLGSSSKVMSFRVGTYGSAAPVHVWDLTTEKKCRSGPQCATFFNGDPTAPIVVESYDASGGTGNLLSTSIVYPFQYGSPVVPLTLRSNPLALQVAFVPPNPQFGVASRLALAAVALGDKGYIVGPAPYYHPVTIRVTGNMRISTTKVPSAAHPVYLSYDGGFESATITAFAQSGKKRSIPTTVRPVLSVSEQRLHVPASGLAVAGDGSIWVASRGGCALVKVQADLTTRMYSTQKNFGCPEALTTGPDGRIWFASRKGVHDLEFGFIGFVTSQGTLGGYKTPFGPASGLATGSDGRLWAVRDSFGNQVAAMTTAGVVTIAPFKVPGANYPRIAAGPDGNLWIANNVTGSKGFYVVNTSGELVQFVRQRGVQLPLLGTGNYLYASIVNQKNRETKIGEWNAKRRMAAAFPVGEIGAPQLSLDSSGALWFSNGSTLGRISSSGAYCELTIPQSAISGGGFVGLVSAPDGDLYYARGNAVGKVNLPK